MEISSFLKELSCPYHRLLDGPLSSRYRSEEDSLLLIEFLAAECVTGVINQQKRNEEMKHQIDLVQHPGTPLSTVMQMFQLLDLDVNSMGTDITDSETFNRIIHRLKEFFATDFNAPDLLFVPKTNLNEAQWAQLDQCHTDLQEEYNLRRQMMMTRLDVTMLGFQWKGDTKLDVAQIWRQKRRNLDALTTNLNRRDISDLLVAERSLLTMEKVASTRIKGSKKNVFQGNLTLPNRGGVVSINAKPHMPVWSSREEGLPCENLYRKQSKVPRSEPSKSHQKLIFFALFVSVLLNGLRLAHHF
ncbi:AAEL010247-PA [Aedes aegypti]|nr:AAEL010247-PA [Aedes aegypti]